MMRLLKFPSCLMSLFFLSSAPATNLRSSTFVSQEERLYSADVGESVTLPCLYNRGAVMIYWFKQTLGQKPNVVATFYKHNPQGHLHDEFQNNSRFALESGNGKNHLQISDLQTSDSATYFCAANDAQTFEFGGGARLTVRGSGLKIQTLVHQSGSDGFQPGGSGTRSCLLQTGTCDGEHSVYWFRSWEETRPGLLYTHGDRKDQCEGNPNAQTHTCVYNLPVEKPNASDWTCAVSVCGHILFGNRTDMASTDSADGLDPLGVLVYVLSGALTVTSLLIVWMTSSVYRLKKRSQNLRSESHVRHPADSEGSQEAENLHYATLKKPRLSRATSQRDDTLNECVYSIVKR